jgi:hypothetical protein
MHPRGCIAILRPRKNVPWIEHLHMSLELLGLPLQPTLLQLLSSLAFQCTGMLVLRIFLGNKRCGQVSIGQREMERITVVGREGKVGAPSFL